MLAHCSGVPALLAAPKHASEETAVHACCTTVFAVFLMNCLLVLTPQSSSSLQRQHPYLLQWVDPEILPAARAEQTLWSRCWWEAAPSPAEIPWDAAWQDALGRGKPRCQATLSPIRGARGDLKPCSTTAPQCLMPPLPLLLLPPLIRRFLLCLVCSHPPSLPFCLNVF